LNKINVLCEKLNDLPIQRNISLKSLVTFRIGGPAAAYFQPNNENQILSAIKVCKEMDIPYFIMGNGSNLLVRDGGFPGLIIHIGESFSKITQYENTFIAQAGASLTALAYTAATNGYMGLEWAYGIPGTIGGACAMNAGAYNGEFKQVLRCIRVIHNNQIESIFVSEDDFDYRYSKYAAPDYVVLAAEISLQKDDGGALERQKHYLQLRKEKQPLQYPNAGSIFKRPPGHYAGKLIEDAGLKGFRIGDAMVSDLHAGFIINCANATAKDVLALIDEIQVRVKDKFNVDLTCEIKVIGTDGD